MPSIGSMNLLLTRREFIAKSGIAAIALHPLMGCGSSSSMNTGSSYPVPKYGDTYFTLDYKLPQTQDAEQLATFMESDHPEYSLNGWYFMGSLVDAANPDDTISFIIQAQRNATLGLVSGYEQFPVGIGYIRKPAGKPSGKWRLWFFTELDGTDLISINANPWNVIMNSPFQDDPLLSMQTVGGRMGQVGTQYIVKANVPGLDGSTLKADIRFRDRYGVINQGYGTTAFCVQNMTAEQRAEILTSYEGYVQAYLEKTEDPMIDQGDFYYQMPFLDVESFSIRDGDTELDGTQGLLWADVITASYDATANTVYKNMYSTFFAIQFPDLNVAMMVLQIDSARGSALTATLYDDNSQRSRNSARTPAFSWPINGIIIESDSTRQWYSKASKTYWPLRYHIRLASSQRNADLTVDMKMEDMEIVQEHELTYAGPASVAGTIDGQVVNGQVFIEVWSGVKE